MSVEAIASVGAAEIAPLESAAGVARTQPADGAFESLLAGLQDLNSQMVASERSTAQLALGHTDNLHQVIMTSERTRLDFELLLAVRNKVLDAYQELMRMQV